MSIQQVIKIRELKSEDMKNVFEIERRSFKNPYPLSLLKHLHNLHPDGFLVSDWRGKLVGYVIGFLRWGRTGHILAIAVDPPYRRRGVGSALIINMIDRLLKKGSNKIRLEVRATNQTAQKFYEKFGFKKRKMIPGYYSDGESAVLMIYKP